MDELVKRGLDVYALRRELWLNACRRFGVEHAVAPTSFPLGHGDHLRANGIELEADQALLRPAPARQEQLRTRGHSARVPSGRGGQQVGLDLLRRADRRNGTLVLDGEPLTCERIKLEVERAFGEHGAAAEEFVVLARRADRDRARGRVGADRGRTTSSLFDLFPRDRASACFADFTRTFSVGTPSDELREYHRLAKEALDLAVGAVKPGVRGSDIHRLVCDFFHEHGHKTQLHKEEGEVLRDGYFHGTGHGVGLEVHEQPGLGRVQSEPLVAGDVIAVEPGLYRHGFGGARVEDLLLVTRRRLRGADRLPVRPRAVSDTQRSTRSSSRSAGIRRRRSSQHRRTRGWTSTSASSRHSGRPRGASA